MDLHNCVQHFIWTNTIIVKIVKHIKYFQIKIINIDENVN
jgi:hypothetical protein